MTSGGYWIVKNGRSIINDYALLETEAIDNMQGLRYSISIKMFKLLIDNTLKCKALWHIQLPFLTNMPVPVLNIKHQNHWANIRGRNEKLQGSFVEGEP